jgi:hypothetical protein
MKVKLLFATILFAAVLAKAQPNISSWHLNVTGAKGKYWDMPGPTLVTMTDSAGVTKLCYTSSYVYVRTRDLASNFTMGPAVNPNDPVAQNYTIRFPKTPSQQTGTKTAVPTGGGIGLAIDGVLLYGVRSADSYKSSTNTNTGTGDGKWNCDAWYNEKLSMDTSGNGHSDGAGKYHYHASPKKLYTYPSTAHSAILGFAIDGYPIYGPYGYTTPTNSLSVIKRMVSSYQLRSITTRTAYANGTITTPAGPNVSATFPLGMYVQDYEYVSGSGDLDDLNGRFCITPEYPSGTYAYFMTVDNSGSPAHPFLLAYEYYGVITAGDAGPGFGTAGMSTTGLTCVTTVTGIDKIVSEDKNIVVYPNPASEMITVSLKNYKFNKIEIRDLLGKTVYTSDLQSLEESISLRGLEKGIYFILLSDHLNNTEAIRFVKN